MIDPSYNARNDIIPWIAPFCATALCLLGYWNMRRWSVIVYAPLIVVQGALVWVGWIPVATTALVLQAALWVVGLIHAGKML